MSWLEARLQRMFFKKIALENSFSLDMKSRMLVRMKEGT
jgi:hypothetical protein